MTELGFVILAENTPRISDEEMERLRKLYPVEDEDFWLTPLGKAVCIVRQGFPALPCRPDNHAPYIAGGFNSATDDETQIREWFGIRYPQALVGIPNGKVNLSFSTLT